MTRIFPSASATARGQAMRNLHLEPQTPGAVDFGIIHNVPVFFDHVSARGFRLAGIFVHGQTSGDSTVVFRTASSAKYTVSLSAGGDERVWFFGEKSQQVRCYAERNDWPADGGLGSDQRGESLNPPGRLRYRLVVAYQSVRDRAGFRERLEAQPRGSR